MLVWKGFHVICGGCNYRNRPHKQTRQGIALALLRQLGKCRSCGKQLNLIPDSGRPVIAKVRMALIEAGFLMLDGTVVDPPPDLDPLEVVDWRNDPTTARR